MGFLDSLVSDLVADATGIKSRHVRKLVRGVGLKNILMVGGAALAGGVAASQASSGGLPGGTTASRTPAQSPPPPLPTRASSAKPTQLPPVPGSTAVPPDLPPLPTPTSAEPAPEEALSDQATLAIARTLVAAAMADGELGAEERRSVMDHLRRSSLPPDGRQQIEEDLEDPPSPEALSLLAQTPADGEALYRFAALIHAADGEIQASESAWLDRLARALGLPDERAAELRSGQL